MKFFMALAFSTMMIGSVSANTCARTSVNHCDTQDKCLGLNKSGEKAFVKFEGGKCLVAEAGAKTEDCVAGNQGPRSAKPVVPAAGGTTVEGADAAKR